MTVEQLALKYGMSVAEVLVVKAKVCSGKTLHGQSRTSAYSSWANMLQRCYNPNNPEFEYWGGRGITVCVEWVGSFTTFFKDMGQPPEGMSLDRKDNEGNYCKENCRWATSSEQNSNKRKRKRLR